MWSDIQTLSGGLTFFKGDYMMKYRGLDAKFVGFVVVRNDFTFMNASWNGDFNCYFIHWMATNGRSMASVFGTKATAESFIKLAQEKGETQRMTIMEFK